LVQWAAAESERLLGDTGDRWLHVQGVVDRARRVAGILGESDQEVLLAAAHVHDIGYAEELRCTGAHQLDGARYLRGVGEERLARLVARHSESRYELEDRGLDSDLATFDHEDSVVADALTYRDVLTGPIGKPTSPAEWVADVERRYGEGTLVVIALRRALPALRAAVERTELRLGGQVRTEARPGGRSLPALPGKSSSARKPR